MYEITMPVYWTNKKKTKKDTVHLCGMNFFRNAYYHTQNKMKQEISNIVAEKLVKESITPIKGKYKIVYTYHYKSKVSDLMNVGSMMSKIFNDVLQEKGYVINDNVQYCIEETFHVGEKSKDNPHMQVQLYPIDQTS